MSPAKIAVGSEAIAKIESESETKSSAGSKLISLLNVALHNLDIQTEFFENSKNTLVVNVKVTDFIAHSFKLLDIGFAIAIRLAGIHHISSRLFR